MSKDRSVDADPLVARIDRLLRGARTGARGADAGVPVLTEVVEGGPARRGAAATNRESAEQLARELERAVLERLGAEIDRILAERLLAVLDEAIEHSRGYLRAELNASARKIVRDSIASAVEQALGSLPPKPPAPSASKR